MRKKLQDYLPPILLRTCEFPLLCMTGQAEIDALIANTAEVMDSQFVTTAPVRGIERYEKIFNIIPKDTDTLEERRARILAKMNAQLPYTIRMLKQQLTALCGENGYTVEMIHAAYHLIVHLLEDVQGSQNAVYELLQGIVPANILWEINIESVQQGTVFTSCLMQTSDDLYMEQELPRSDFEQTIYPGVWMTQYDNLTI